ncbi:MAG: dTDP-4-amino-4,6-dideoxygalactose transaminase [Bradymonadales bacterium]|nr:MAG: dTDP-4-amino-4,6-dideoxygalactose transaminase [Bradymonadales bacterium]
MIKFNVPNRSSLDGKYLGQLLNDHEAKFSGDGPYSKKCSQLIETMLGGGKALLTTSCTDALEMAAILCDIKEGDEVIMPSFTFVSTANAFVLRGAKLVFIDIRPDTLNIDETLIEAAITPKTKAIVVVHYAGVACEMDEILAVANRLNVPVIEDAAQAYWSFYRGRPLGSFGKFATFSFHETKNIHCGEGGALIVNDPQSIRRAEIIREKGTNRSEFVRGEVDKYTWLDIGSSFLPSELNSAYLLGQLEQAKDTTDRRLKIWENYFSALEPLEKKGFIKLPKVPSHCKHNGHIFALTLQTECARDDLKSHLRESGIESASHYVPLHSSPAGQSFGRFFGKDTYTTDLSLRLLRLPLHSHIEAGSPENIVKSIFAFFGVK